MRLLVIALLTACQPASPAPHFAENLRPASCPASFAAAKVSAGCSGIVECPFAEGTCTCTSGSYCGGTPPPPKVLEEDRRLRWVCSKKPPEVRDDGCPGVRPSGACGSEARECQYAQGCCSVVVNCVEGQWTAGDKQCPP